MIILNNDSIYKMSKKPIVPIQYYMKKFDDTDKMWIHKHEYYEIMYVSSGKCSITISNEETPVNTTSYDLVQGQFIFIMPNIFHQLVIKEGNEAFLYNIELQHVNYDDEHISNVFNIINVDYEKLFNNTKLTKLIASKEGFIITSDISQVGTTIKELILCCVKKQKTKEDYLSLILKEANLFVEISNCINSKRLGDVTYIKKANTYILENYTRKILIDDIAKHVNISKSYLEHQYKKYMGQSILSFINLLRVQRAEKLLLNTSKSISEIALTVGYKDKNQLNYEFKKKTGMSPRDYKKNNVDTIDFINKDYVSIGVNIDENL